MHGQPTLGEGMQNYITLLCLRQHLTLLPQKIYWATAYLLSKASTAARGLPIGVFYLESKKYEYI